MPWWVPSPPFILAFWKCPPARPANVELLKSGTWIWGNAWLLLVAFDPGCPACRPAPRDTRGPRAPLSKLAQKALMEPCPCVHWMDMNGDLGP